MEMATLHDKICVTVFSVVTKRNASRNHFVKHTAEAVNIRPMVHRLGPHDLFGAHIMGGADAGTCAGLSVLAYHQGNTEICEVSSPPRIKQDIAGPPPRYSFGHPFGDNPLRGAHEEEGRNPAGRGSGGRP